jgi:hypothetical protein
LPRTQYGQRLEATLFSFLSAHDHQRCCTVIDAGGICGRYSAFLGKGRAKLLHRFHCCPMTNVLVILNHNIALAGLHRERGDLILELAGFLGSFCLVLGGNGELVLLLARDLPFLGNVLCGLAHMVAVERVPQAVLDHGVDHLVVAHFVAGTHRSTVRRHGHVFLTTCDHDGRIAGLDLLRCNRNGAKT